MQGARSKQTSVIRTSHSSVNIVVVLVLELGIRRSINTSSIRSREQIVVSISAATTRNSINSSSSSSSKRMSS